MISKLSKVEIINYVTYFKCSDRFNCSKPYEASLFTCEGEWMHEDCGQLENSKHQNYGCKHVDGEKYEYFECINRMDKARILFDFNNPPVPSNRTQTPRNYNEILNFDENFIYCGQRNISYDEFVEIKKWNATEKCFLGNLQNITLRQLWNDLLTDFSFNYSYKFGEL